MASPENRYALLTYGRSLMAVVAARSLHRQGVNVIGCDSIDCTALQFSRYCEQYFVAPDYGDAPDDYADFLIDKAASIAHEHNAGIVIMPMFRDAKILAERKTRLPRGVAIAAADAESIGMVHPKDAFHEFAERCGLPSPATEIIRDARALAGIADRIEAPVVVKPADGVGGRGVSFCDTREQALGDIRGLLDRGDNALVQEPVPGDDYCVTILADKGELIAISAYKNLSTFPRDGGAGALRETVDHEPFEAAAGAFARLSAWSGIAEIDFRWDRDGDSEPGMIEVNPRFWAGLLHSMASGIDFPWLAYRQAAGEKVDFDPDQIAIGRVTKTPVLWAASALAEMAEEGFDFKSFQESLHASGADFKRGRFSEAVKKLSSGLSDAVSFDDAMFTLFSRVDNARNAPDELSSANDPFVSLGALFVASSLIRHRKLPDEVKF